MYFAGEVPRGQKRKRGGDEGDDDWNFPTLLHLFILTCRVIKICTAYFYIIYFFLCFAFANHFNWIAKHKIFIMIETKWWKQVANFATCFWVVPHSLISHEYNKSPPPLPSVQNLHKSRLLSPSPIIHMFSEFNSHSR